ncbi:hypothetical protein ALC56_13070, partial [Trachymyrmex septentrionalis]
DLYVTFKQIFKVKLIVSSYVPLETIQFLSETFFRIFHIFLDIWGNKNKTHGVHTRTRTRTHTVPVKSPVVLRKVIRDSKRRKKAIQRYMRK